MNSNPARFYISVNLNLEGMASGKVICGNGYAPELLGVNAPFEMSKGEGIVFDSALITKKDGAFFHIEELGTFWIFPKNEWLISKSASKDIDYFDSWTFSEAVLKLALGEL